MITPRQTTLIIISTLFLTACGGGGSSSSPAENKTNDSPPANNSPVENNTDSTDIEDSTPATPISLNALENLTLPQVHFGNRNISFNGKLDDSHTHDDVTLTLTHNGKNLDVVIAEDAINTMLELTDNTNKFILTISNGSETLSREFFVEYPFVSLETFQAADVVIGQDNFKNIGSDTTASTFEGPYGNAFSYANTLYLPDYDNNRVLGFNTIPETNGAVADFVIGQEDFISNNTDGDGLVSLGGPQNMQVVNEKFFILAYDSNRIIASDVIPTETGQLIPSFVIGQEDSASTDSSCTANSLDSPESFIIADNKLIVADNGNNRILIWNSLPTVSGVAADIVIGHNNFTCDSAEEELSLDSASGVWSDGKTLLVADSGNDRVLLWHTFPETNNVQPDLILGTDLLTGNTVTASEELEATEELTQFDFPYYLHSNGNQLFISDNNNHRLLIWNSLPTTENQKPDIILGQSNLTNITDNDDNQDGESDQEIITNDNGPSTEKDITSSRTLSSPRGSYTINNQLIVTDGGNNRYLIFNGANNAE